MGQIYQAIDVKKTVNLFNIKHFVKQVRESVIA